MTVVSWIMFNFLAIAAMKRFLVMPKIARRAANFGVVASTALPCVVLQDLGRNSIHFKDITKT